MADIAELEDLVKEYLVFRGLTNAAKAFDFDTKNDNKKGMKVSDLIEFIERLENAVLIFIAFYFFVYHLLRNYFMTSHLTLKISHSILKLI